MATINGTSGDDTLNGTSGDDTITGGAGNDTITGGDGTDRAVFSGAVADYLILHDSVTGAFTVVDKNAGDGDDGTDVLSGIETLEFSDTTVDLTGTAPLATASVVQVPEDGLASHFLTGSGGADGADAGTDVTLNYELIGLTASTDGGHPSGAGWYETAHGYVRITDAATGEYEYDPVGSYTGADSFGFRVTDELGISSEATVDVGVGTEYGVAAVLGHEMRISTFESGAEANARLTLLSDGRAFIAFSADGDIYGRFFAADGAPQGPEILINSYTTDLQGNTQVTLLDNGNILVTWQSYLQDGSSWGVYAQILDSSGDKVGSEIQVSNQPSGEQAGQIAVPLDSGDFLIAYRTRAYGGGDREVYARRFEADGTPDGGEFKVNAYSTSTQGHADGISLADGTYVLVWHSGGQDGSDYGLIVRHYEEDGTPISGEIVVNTHTSQDQWKGKVEALNDGGFFVVWESENQDGDGFGIYGQRFSSSAAKVGSELQINTTVTGNQTLADLAVLSDGSLFVVWQSDGQDGDGAGIYGQFLEVDGTKVGNEIRVAETTADDQWLPSVLSVGGDEVLVTWSSGEQGAESFAFSRRLTKSFTGDAGEGNDYLEGQGGTLDVDDLAFSGGTITNNQDGTFTLNPGSGLTGDYVLTYDLLKNGVPSEVYAQVTVLPTGTPGGTSSGVIEADPHFEDVRLLLHLDGDFSDSSAGDVVVQNVGGLSLTGAQSKFGSESVNLPSGSSGNAYLKVTDSSVVELGTEDYTIEGWFRPTSVAGYTLFTFEDSGAGSAAIGVATNSSGALQLFNDWAAGADLVTSGASLTVNQWHHIAVVRDTAADLVRLFMNGTEVLTISDPANDHSSIQLSIGTWTVNSDRDFIGQIDEFRVTHGVARYTDDFTAPTEAFPDIPHDIAFFETLEDVPFDVSVSDLLAPAGDFGVVDEVIDGKGGDDLLKGNGGDDYLIGGEGNDKLLGGTGEDSLDGGAGDDVLAGGGGADTLLGGDGNDVLRGDALEGVNPTAFADGEEFDQLALRGVYATGTAFNGDITITDHPADSSIKVFGAEGPPPSDAAEQIARNGTTGAVETVEMRFDELMLNATVYFTNLVPSEEGGERGQVDAYRDGVLVGTEVFDSGDVTDPLSLGITGSGSIDIATTGGFDRLVFTPLETEHEVTDTNDANDNDDSSDFFIHRVDTTALETAGNDTLDGGAGDDLLFGGAGDDALIGGLGMDILEGGAGADVFIYTAAAQSTDDAMRDVINDFNAGTSTTAVDSIDISAIVTGTFDFLGADTESFTDSGNTEARFNNSTKILEIDADGDAEVDMEIELKDVDIANLDDSDFTVS